MGLPSCSTRVVSLLLCLAGVVSAQPVITSAPNYCCFSIGLIQEPLTATGGNGTYTWSLVSGALPPGVAIRTDVPLLFSSVGLSGVTTTPGTYNFTLQATSNG